MISVCLDPSPAGVAGCSFADWFHAQVLPHGSVLRAWLRRQFPSLDADDLIQETYLRVWRVRPAVPPSNARAFLFRIARNLALDQLRRRKVAPFVDITAHHAGSIAEDAPCAAERASRRQEIGMLEDAIATLPLRQQAALTLRRLHGLSQQEVAEQLGIGVHTATCQASLGLRQCREYLMRLGCGIQRNCA